jgi:hypothetical protein
LEGDLHVTGGPPVHYVPPVYEYPHTDDRCAVIGGLVYRGTAIPGLRGAYVYTDFCQGRLIALLARGRRVTFQRSLGVTLERADGFAQDSAGELYVLSLARGIYRLAPVP